MEKRERKVSFSAFSDILIHYTVIRRKKQGKRERNFPAESFNMLFRRGKESKGGTAASERKRRSRCVPPR